MTRAIGSWAFFKMLKETLIAYFFDIGGLLAGFLVASQLGIFQHFSWAIAIYPAIVSAKGVIGGLLSGRLSTALHIGTIYASLFKNTKSFYSLYAALIVTTLATSIVMSLVSLIFGLLFWGIAVENFLEILLVVVATMSLGLVLTLVTVNVAFVTFKKGLDPDIVVYPIMSTTADIFITMCYILILSVIFLFDFGKHIVAFIGLLHVVLVLYILSRNIHEEEFVKTVKESLFTLMFVAFIVNLTGTVLHRISEKVIVRGGREIYTVYPALIDMVGDVGSVVGCTATTKLALGLLKPSFRAMRNHATQIFSAWIGSAIMFALLSALSLSINGMLYAFLSFTCLLLITNLIAVSSIVLLSYSISIITFQKGLDPDNFVIPIESSVADSVTTMALLIALSLVGQV